MVVGLDPGAELGEVLDDPVVHQRHAARALPFRIATCGWALTSLGAPWVAQRVCPTPVVDAGSGTSAMAFSRFASLPAFLETACLASATTAIPAES